MLLLLYENEVEMGEDERRKRFNILSTAQIVSLQYKDVHLLLPRLSAFNVKRLGEETKEHSWICHVRRDGDVPLVYDSHGFFWSTRTKM